MNNKEKTILKILNEKTEPHNKFTIDNLIKKTNYTEEELDELLSDLIKKELVDSTFLNICEIDVEKLYYSTLSGKEYFKNQKKKLLEKIFLNIFCPIIVSFITTIITNFFFE